MPLDMPLLPNAQTGMTAVAARQCKPDLALTPRLPAFQFPDSGLSLAVKLNRMGCLILAGQLWCTAHLSCRISHPQVTAAACLEAQADGGHSYPLPETGPRCLRLLDPW